MTHTYATLPVSRSVFDEIRIKLEAAGYADQIDYDKQDAAVLIDMHGLALEVEG